MIDPALSAFLQAGVAIHVGTRNDHLHPNGARGIGVAVDPDGRHVVVYVAAVAAPRLLEDLRANGQAAVVFCRPTDDRSCQVKGVFDGVRAAADEERPVLAAQWSGFMRELEAIGIPAATLRGWVTWPAVAIRLRVTELYDQTPGPNAGAKLA